MKDTVAEAVDKAIALLPVNGTFHWGEHQFRILFLLPESLWRPLKVAWWTGKEVSIIGGGIRMEITFFVQLMEQSGTGITASVTPRS